MEETNEPEEPVVDVGVQTRKRKQPGLNNQKPPKKTPRMPAVFEETRDLEAVVNVGTNKKEETNNKET